MPVSGPRVARRQARVGASRGGQRLLGGDGDEAVEAARPARSIRSRKLRVSFSLENSPGAQPGAPVRQRSCGACSDIPVAYYSMTLGTRYRPASTSARWPGTLPADPVRSPRRRAGAGWRPADAPSARPRPCPPPSADRQNPGYRTGCARSSGISASSTPRRARCAIFLTASVSSAMI